MNSASFYKIGEDTECNGSTKSKAISAATYKEQLNQAQAFFLLTK